MVQQSSSGGINSLRLYRVSFLLDTSVCFILCVCVSVSLAQLHTEAASWLCDWCQRTEGL